MNFSPSALAVLLSLSATSFLNAEIYSSRFSSHDIYLYDEITGVRIGPGPFIPAQPGLTNPHGIIDRTTDILVASWTQEIKRYDRVTGAFLGNFVESGQGLNNPVYLETGPNDGYLYVSSQGNDQIYRYNALGENGTSIDGGPWISGGNLDGPSGFDWSPDGSLLYVAGRFSTNVIAYNASTGAVVGEFSTSNSNNNTFGLAVDDASGDIFVAVDGNVIRYDVSGGFPGVADPAPPSTNIAIPGTAIGLEPSADGSTIYVAAGNNLYGITIADNTVSGAFFTSNDGNIHNFFHFSESSLPPRTTPLEVEEAGLVQVSPGDTLHFSVTFTFSETDPTQEAVVQLSDDLATWTDAAVYSATGADLIRNAAVNSIQADLVDNGSTQTITERQASTVNDSPHRGFARVLRRIASP